MLADLRFRLRALFRRRALERELDAELRFHLEQEIEKHVRAGLTLDDAERRARLAFGGVERIKDDARDVRGIVLLDTLAQDLRYAWRGLRAKPGFTAAVVLTLALGIGANTAMFGVVDRMLFRAPEYLESPDRTHRVFLSYLWQGRARTERGFAYTRYTDLAESVTAFERLAAFANRTAAVGRGSEAREMPIAAVSASFFDLFDARPVLGRFFTADEDRTPVGAFVAVLANGHWRAQFGGRPDVIGEVLHVGPQVFTIIGVAPEGFAGIPESATPIAFLPITTVASQRGSWYHQNYNWSWLEILARRKPGVSVAAADADLTMALQRSWTREREMQSSGQMPPAIDARVRGHAEPVLLSRGPDASADSLIVAWVMGVAVIVLLVACANVANLLLARALARRREVALRLALGVSRGRLLQQLLTESALLAAIGGAAGLAVAQFGGGALRSLLLPADDATVAGDPRTLAFAAAITLAVALLTGLAPAMHALREDVASALKAGTREAGGAHHRSRLRTMLLLFQGALSVVLLVGAGLFVRSHANVRSMRLGYDVDPIVLLAANLRGEQLSETERMVLSERLVSAAAATPGVRGATIAASVPFYSFEGRGAPIVEGRDSLGKLGRFTLQVGTPSYFQTTGTRILRGRGIAEEDRAGSPLVMVVTNAMAQAIWPGLDPIGRQLGLQSPSGPMLYTVVGVTEDMRGGGLQGDPEFWYFLPAEQYKVVFGELAPQIFARVSGRAEDYVGPLRARLQEELPGEAYMNAIPLRRLIEPQQRSWRFGATMFVAFGSLALVLAAIGLYGVVSYSVAQRTHELGVRIALGADAWTVVRMVVQQATAVAGAGAVIGSLIALSASRWVEPLLFEQSARDPVVFGAVGGVLVTVALLASVRPALRATRVDPMLALRAD